MAEFEKENALPIARRNSSGAQALEDTKKKSYWRNVAKSNLKSTKGPTSKSNLKATKGLTSKKNDFGRPNLHHGAPPQHQAPHHHRSFKKSQGEKNKIPFHILLKNLQEEDNYKVVFMLAQRSNELSGYVKGKLELSEFQCLLSVLRKVCVSDYDQNKAVLITLACQPELLNRFPTILVEAASMGSATLQSAVGDIVLFFKTATQMLPLTAILFKSTIQSCLSALQHGLITPQMDQSLGQKLIKQVEDVLQDLEALQPEVLAGKPSWLLRRKEQLERMKFQLPPDDFRQINIYPSAEDVLCAKRPFLRPNIVKGPYLDVEQYLDVQFRLLREDFLRPLRDGVQDIIHSTNSRKCETRSVRVYPKVKFLKYVRETNDNELVLNEGFLLCFDAGPVKKLRNVDWKYSKKFLYGGLVCFTANNFKTVLFATISGRDLKLLNQCQILVNFCQEITEDIFEINKTYMMLESEVFFEPYFQVLSSLQRLDESNFPMTDYLIHLKNEDSHPLYMTENEAAESDILNRDPIIKVFGKPIDKIRKLFEYNVLNSLEWPNAEQLGLDASQYTALQAALTKELAVIQGPPGTGKTFMALKIAEILIYNKTRLGIKKPILVVSLTNHALDQFLVGMLKFTDKLVRIGGQSKNAEMANYTLKSIRIPWSGRSGELKHALNAQRKSVTEFQTRLNNVNSALACEGVVTNPLWQGENVDLQVWLLGPALSSFSAVFEQTYFSFGNLLNLIQMCTTECIRFARENIEGEKLQQKAMKSANYYDKFLKHELSCVESILTRFKDDYAIGEVDYQLTTHPKKIRDEEEKLLCYFQMLKEEKIMLEKKVLELQSNLSNKCNEYYEVKNMEKIEHLIQQDVIGLTTTGGAKMHKMLNAIGCKIVIVEEAAEVMESHIIACVSKNCEHLILIGDHKQLRPSIAVYELEKLYNFDVSLFERMVNNREGCVTLQVQHRMCPEMAHLIVPTIYKTLENHESVLNRTSVKSMPKRLFFKTHTNLETMDHEISSRKNMFEADFIIALCRHLLNQGYGPSEITILATYTGQMFLIKKKIFALTHEELLQEVSVTVVDNYQGEENKIILLSLVRSNEEERIGFLATENRVCVALSRARDGFFIVGNMNILAAKNPTWIAVKKSLEKQEAIGSSIPVRCEIHPAQTFDFENPGDALKHSPKGGCTLMCEDTLSCGHRCTQVCHLMVLDHSKIKCLEPCMRFCIAGLHRCKEKCFVDCTNICRVIVEKELNCGHLAKTKCCTDPSNVNCAVEVEKTFEGCEHQATVRCSSNTCPKKCENQVPCGHSCAKTCHVNDDPDHMQYTCMKPCAKLMRNCSENHPCMKKCYEKCDICSVKVNKKRSCGHSFPMKCHENPEEIDCRENCKKSLPCGHFCKRKCKEPCGSCTQLVEKVVPLCGHTAKVPCSEEPSRSHCKSACERMLPGCGHPCKAYCSVDCTTVKCLEPAGTVMGSCGHSIKTFCYEVQNAEKITANLSRCTAGCDQILACGHKCTGTCKSCYHGRLHVPCTEKVKKDLVCGHSFWSKCGTQSSSCSEKITLVCQHKANVSVQCGHKVKLNCAVNCNYSCQHSKCVRKCRVKCSREPCTEPCDKILPCEHQCSGLCGETCPKLCWQCDREELKTYALPEGAQIPTQPRFLVLPDCGHTFELMALEKWFKSQSSRVEAKSCPSCSMQVSLKLKRFSLALLEPYADWNIITSMVQLGSAFSKQKLINQLEACQNFSRAFPSLQKYSNELLLKLPKRGKKKQKVGGFSHEQLGLESAQILPIDERKIAVLIKLTSILPKSDEPPSSLLMTEVNFLVKVLKQIDTFSLQVMQDLEKLLCSIDSLVNSVPQTSKQRIRAGEFPKELLTKDKLEVPMQLLKNYWQKCLQCDLLQFGLNVESCGGCGTLFSEFQLLQVFKKQCSKSEEKKEEQNFEEKDIGGIAIGKIN